MNLRRKQPNLNIKDEDVLCVQIAALCHDLGHGPFSHTFESFIAELRPEIHWKHETASVQMLDYMIKKNNLMPSFQKAKLNEIDLIFIKELIHCEFEGQHSNEVS